MIDEFASDFGPLLVDILVNDTRRDLLPTIIDELNDLLWNASLPLAEMPTVKHFQRWTQLRQRSWLFPLLTGYFM